MIQKSISEKERQRLHKQHWDWLKFIALCALAGITFGALISLWIINSDLNGFGSLLARSANRVGFTILLVAGFASTFGMVAMGVGITIRSQVQDRQD